jgi:hypothetical protein
MIFAIISFIMVGLVIGEVVYEIRTGKLIGRSWKVYSKRRDNPMLYWSTVILQVMIALTLLGIWLLAVLGSARHSVS